MTAHETKSIQKRSVGLSFQRFRGFGQNRGDDSRLQRLQKLFKRDSKGVGASAVQPGVQPVHKPLSRRRGPDESPLTRLLSSGWPIP